MAEPGIVRINPEEIIEINERAALFGRPASPNDFDGRLICYQIPVPRQVNGADVLGWLITLEQGTPNVRIHKSASDFGQTAPVTMIGRSALIVPPFLTFDSNWYIEVEATERMTTF